MTRKDELRALVVLGGGVLADGRPSPFTAARVRRAASVWHAGGWTFVVCSGRRGLYEAEGQPTEAEVMADGLARSGVPRAVLRMETTSVDTLGNAWFTETEHLAPQAVRRATIVTSAFHLERALRVFALVAPRLGVSGAAAPDAFDDAGHASAFYSGEVQRLAELEALAPRFADAAGRRAFFTRGHPVYGRP